MALRKENADQRATIKFLIDSDNKGVPVIMRVEAQPRTRRCGAEDLYLTYRARSGSHVVQRHFRIDARRRYVEVGSLDGARARTVAEGEWKQRDEEVQPLAGTSPSEDEAIRFVIGLVMVLALLAGGVAYVRSHAHSSPQPAPAPILPYVSPSSSNSYGSSSNSYGSGYAVQCADGTTSYSGGRPGACSWHGGEAP